MEVVYIPSDYLMSSVDIEDNRNAIDFINDLQSKYHYNLYIHCYIDNVKIPFHKFRRVRFSCYLIIPKGILPEQYLEIVIDNKVYIKLHDKAGGVESINQCMTIREYNDMNKLNYLRCDLENIISLTPPNVRDLFMFMYTANSYMIWNYIFKYGPPERFKKQDLMNYICDVIAKYQPSYLKYAQQIVKLDSIFNEYDNIFHPWTYTKCNYGITAFDVLLKLTKSPEPANLRIKTPYLLNDFIYIPDEVTYRSFNVDYVIEKYPDINENPLRFGWWMNNIMPYCIYKFMERPLSKFMFYDIAGYIGLWSMFCESGNGCNSYLLNHPISLELCKHLMTLLLTPCNYRSLLLHFKIISNDPLIEPDPEIVRTINIDEHMEDFKTLSGAIGFVRKYSWLYKHYKNNMLKLNHEYPDYKFKYPEDIIPSPSGLTLIPWLVVNE